VTSPVLLKVDMQIEIWSDVVCPWCYIGKRRFENALSQFPNRDDVEVIHRSFELDPGMTRGTERPTVDVLGEKYGAGPAQVRQMMARVEQNAAEEGLEYHLTNTLSGNSRDAHRLVHLAREKGVQNAVLERLYRAYFTEGKSLFDRDVLAEIGGEAGLDPTEVKQVLSSDRFEAEVTADENQARAFGISGVPFFVIDGRYGISGAQPTALFAQALQQAWAESQGAAPAELFAQEGAACTDDSCTDEACAVPETSAAQTAEARPTRA
jgi:predicted DsbA family dithiol-disulfide isomerase